MKSEYDKINEFADRSDEIRGRRYFLLWHNEKFQKDFNDTCRKTQEIPTFGVPEYWGLRKIRDLKHELWKEFNRRYQINNEWPEGERVLRYGDRPIGFELIWYGTSQYLAKLIIWPETTLEDVRMAWPHYKATLDDYCPSQSSPYNLGVGHFWRDARWYRQRKIQNLTYRQIAEHTAEFDPEVIDQLVLPHFIESNAHRLKVLDPGNKITNSGILSKSEKNNKLLYNIGILKIGIAKDNYGYPAREFPPVKPGASEELIKGEEYYVRYDFDLTKFELFEEKKESPNPDKESLREDFLLDRDDYIKQRAEFDSGLIQLIKKAIKDMQKRIDSII